MSKVWLRRVCVICLFLLCMLLPVYLGFAHDSGTFNDNPRGVEVLNWPVENIHKVLTAGYPVTFGLYAYSRRQPHEFIQVADGLGQYKNCIKANFLAFDIDDDFAFDIDEQVTIELLIDRAQTRSLVYGYDQHANASANGNIAMHETEKGLYSYKIVLERARLANRGISNTDFSLTTQETMQADTDLPPELITTFVLCDIKVTRSYLSPTKTAGSQVHLRFIDQQSGENTPVRFGLYDNKGSAVLISNDALTIKYYEENVRQLSLSAFYPPYQFWPHTNRYFFYSDGELLQELAPGTYSLVASKGPEYRIIQQQFTVTSAGEIPLEIAVTMQRWQDLPSQHWYSGDVHIHMRREQPDNQALLSLLAAEDVHFSNLLEMSTYHSNHFKQYAWGKAGQFVKDEYAIIPGIEGPRTAHRGHAIALNTREAFEQEESYFLYHEYFKYYQQQNAVIGYAHVGSEEFNASWGLALDVPFGLVDFVEIMQASRLRTDIWYQFLNLGFRLAPAAGSDFPYFDQPGAVRSYVFVPGIHTNKAITTGYIEKDNTVQGFKTKLWFDQLKQGTTFVSNAPFIQLSVNDHLPGDSINLGLGTVLNISAKVAINPDFDRLASLELVHCGQVIKQLSAADAKGDEQMNFNYQLTTSEGGWLAVRANGIDYALAHSGAIYLTDSRGQSLCHRQAAQNIDLMLTRLSNMENAPMNSRKELEYWETKGLDRTFLLQQPTLKLQINKARNYYQQLKLSLKTNH